MIEIKNQELFKRVFHLHPQIHAKNLDKILGYRISKIEMKLLQEFQAYDKDVDKTNRKPHFQNAQTWIGLHPQALQTPYNDIYETFLQLKDESIKKVVDIGCAYGRVGIVMGHVFPQAQFIGYEIVKHRVQEANRIFRRHDLHNCQVIHTNIFNPDVLFPEADIYFIYDFGETSDISNALMLILERMKSMRFFLIARGDRVESILNKQVHVYWVQIASISTLKIYMPKWSID